MILNVLPITFLFGSSSAFRLASVIVSANCLKHDDGVYSTTSWTFVMVTPWDKYHFASSVWINIFLPCMPPMSKHLLPFEPPISLMYDCMWFPKYLKLIVEVQNMGDISWKYSYFDNVVLCEHISVLLVWVDKSHSMNPYR